MKQDKFEKAIYKLGDLLKRNESQELAFQKILEEHTIIFEAMGYKKAYPKLRLDLNLEDQERLGLDYLEPDFVVERQEGIFEIFEIKTPQEVLLTKSTDRKAFRAKINSYITQSVNYSEYFKDSLYRKLIKEKYGLDFTRDVDIVILVGMDQENDMRRVHEELRQRTSKIQILTYDRLLNNLRFDYINHYPNHDGIAGKFLYGVFDFNKMPNENRKYVFDYGQYIDGNRISVFLNKNNRITFELIDDDGEIYKETGPSIPLNEKISLFCQFGVGDSFTLFEISVNGSIVLSKCILGKINLKIDFKAAELFIGASLDKKYSNSNFYAFASSSGNTLSFEQRLTLDEAVNEYLQYLEGSRKINCFLVGKGGYLKKDAHQDNLKPFGNAKFLMFPGDSSAPQ